MRFKKLFCLCISCFLVLTLFSKNITAAALENKNGKIICGMSYELPKEKIADTLEKDLYRMKYYYAADAVNVYGLERFDKSGNQNKDILFALLEKFDLKIVIRLEDYDNDFSFSVSDADRIIEKYDSLIQYACQNEHRKNIAYFALNMPVDDPLVQQNTGGLNSDVYIERQPVYAKAIVSRVRALTEQYGYYNAKLYLSVFYGWDNSYNTPSYSDSGADGYFLNNYSYPKQNIVATETDSDGDLINAERLRVSMETYYSQYKSSPLIIEFGFHTVEYNGSAVPDQTAGLVANKAAKKRAVKATVDFYRYNYEYVCGFQYFGYNILKNEGSDSAVLDWELAYDEEIERFELPEAAICNSGFESGESGWGITDGFSAGAEIQSATVYSGTNAVAIKAGINGRDLFQSTGWSQERIRIDTGYFLKAMVNDDSLLSGRYKITAEFKRNNNAVLFYSSPEYEGGSDKGWHTVSVDIPQSAAGIYDEILFKLELTAGSGKLYADQFSFEKSNNMLFNGSFENGNGDSAAEWGMWPSWSSQNFIDLKISSDGNRSICIKMNTSQNYSVYSSPVVRGAANEMICSFKIKYESAASGISFRVNRGAGKTCSSDHFDLNGSVGDWIEYSFTVPYDQNAEYFQVQAEVDAGEGTVWLDDVSLRPISGVAYDVNNDGDFNIKDLVRLKKYAADTVSNVTVADVNSDGAINSLDIAFMKKLYLG